MSELVYADIEVGDEASFAKTITEADVVNYAGLTGDFNPAHIDAEYAAQSMFKERIAHGMLVAGLISAVLGTRLPGPNSIYLGQELKFTAPDAVSVKLEGGSVLVAPLGEDKRSRALWGTARARVQNLVVGVTKGFEKKLEINGVGYKAAVAGKNLQLSLGYSHDVIFPIPAGVTITAAKPTEITVAGIDRQQVGQVAAEIREFRRPEPYKGKGVKYAGEFIFRKEGKKK